jgi:hypothetical protein
MWRWLQGIGRYRMSERTCLQVRDAAGEFALDILPPHERAEIAAHVLRCEDCRAEIDSMILLASRLVDLVPRTEPPLGFDNRVMGGLAGHRRRWRRGLGPAVGAAAAVAAALLFGSLEWIAGHHPTRPAARTAMILQAGHSVGNIVADAGRPAWVGMTVRGSTASGLVTCQFQYRDGRVVTIGTFELIHGSGSWSGPDPDGVSELAAARLVDRAGHVVGTARFSSSPSSRRSEKAER